MATETYVVKAVPSSFVFGDMKLLTDKGAGEAKLFVGPKSKESEIDAFFEFENGYTFCFVKENLQEYLQQVKMEYVFQTINHYKDANMDKWNELYSFVSSVDNTQLVIHLEKFVDSSRYYVRANEDIFKKTFRKIVVPKLTDLLFVKNTDEKKIKLKLQVNYQFVINQDASSELTESTIKFESGYRSEYTQNRIIFGAPGTGKSFSLNQEKDNLLENADDYERVTFHPDYSYANFVGTYKPVMVSTKHEVALEEEKKEILAVLQDENKTAQEKYDLLYEKFKDEGLTRLPILLGLYTDERFKTKKQDGTDAVGDNSVERNHGRAIRPYVDLLSTTTTEKEIVYQYVPGPFMRTLVKALKSAMTESPKPYLLLIEEINRANVAAVFGDVFQLLDRAANGVSEYEIATTNDMRAYLAEELGVDESAVETIKIPDNMFIWATMNSADQGVFSMDTAFKRRWDFTYLGIDDAESKMSDEIKKKEFTFGQGDYARVLTWNEIRRAINDELSSESYNINEDKLLGPYFISKSILEGEVDSFMKVFKNKVLMYLFDDAVKQKKKTFFENCKDDKKGVRYSELCDAFYKKGVFIFPEGIYSQFTKKPVISEEGAE